MEDTNIVWTVAGVIVACVVYVARVVLVFYGKAALIGQFDKYKPYAMMAAKWTERNVPDSYGADASDPALAKAAHKLDIFLIKFNEIVTLQEGKEPTEGLKEEAMKWSVELAERLNLTMPKDVQ